MFGKDCPDQFEQYNEVMRQLRENVYKLVDCDGEERLDVVGELEL